MSLFKITKLTGTIAPLSGAITLAAGLTILLGWWFDIAIMRSLIPGFAPASAAAAVCMILAGISQLAFSASGDSRWLIRISQLFAVSLILLGFTTELAVVTGWQVLLDAPWHSAIGAGFAFFLAGLALLSGNWRLSSGLSPSIWLGWIVMALGALSLASQVITGGVIIRSDSETLVRFVVATPLSFILVGLGLALPSSARKLYLSQYQGNATRWEQRIYALLCLALASSFAIFFALLISSIENANRTRDVLETLETDLAVMQIMESSEKIRMESLDYFSAKGGSQSIKQALQAQSLLELATGQLQSSLALGGASAQSQAKCLAEIEQGTRLLRENLQLLASGYSSQDAAGHGGIDLNLADILECTLALQEHMFAFRSSSLERDRSSSRWLFVALAVGIGLLLPVGLFSLRTLRQGFTAMGRAEHEIQRINESLETKIATRTAALIESERGYRNLLDNLPGVVYRIVGKSPFNCEYVSAGSQALLGIAPDEFTSGRRNFTEMAHPDDLASFIEGLTESFNGRDVNLQLRMIRPDGATRWVTAFIHPSRMVEGVAEEFEGYLVDISDSKRADIRREIQTEVLASLSAGDPLQTTLDILTGAVEKQSSGALCSVLLVDESGKFLHYGSAPSLPESYRLATDGLEIGPLSGSCGTAVFRRERVIVEDIETDPLWSEYTSIAAAAGLRSCWSDPMSGPDGEILGTFAVYQREPGPPSEEAIESIEWASYLGSMAIGHVRNLHDQTARAAKEKTDLAKSRFLAAMSHEIRTPLNGVLGMVDLMLNTAQSTLQKGEMMGAIRESSDLLLRVVDDIIAYSLSESGQLKLNVKALDLSRLVHTVVDSLAAEARENDVHISLYCGPGIPSLVLADGQRLQQVLFHLLDNGIKFSGSDAGRVGHVNLRVESRECEDGMARIYLSISDDGIGMSPEDAQRLNQAFLQADTSTTRAFEGTGLGLALTTHLVQLMDSKLDFNRVAGDGLQVSFELLLPISNSQQEPGPGAVPSPLETPLSPSSLADAEASGRLILLAEDNLMNQRVIVLQLQALGYAAEVAGDGREALAMWKNKRYSLLLVDFHMPEMDGFDLVRQIRKQEKGNAQRIPIIGITASTVPSEIELSATVGMDDYLSKPATMETIHEKLDHWLPLEQRAAAASSQYSAVHDEGSVIDWQALSGYTGTDDKVMLADFFTAFLRQSTNTLAEIAQALVAKDAKKAGSLGHRMKSSARMVGANVLADTCLRLERAGFESQWNDIHREYALLQEHFTAVVAEAETHGIVV